MSAPFCVYCKKKSDNDHAINIPFPAPFFPSKTLHRVCTGFEKSLKFEKMWDILEKSWIIFFSGIFLKALSVKITFVIKSVLCKGKIESTAVCKFSWWSWKCVFYDFNVPGILHLLLFKYPRNHTFLGEGIAISQPPSTYECERSLFLLDVILCQITGKRSPWKLLDFFPHKSIWSTLYLYKILKK